MIHEAYGALLIFILGLGNGKILSQSAENIQKINNQSITKYRRNYLWQKKAFLGFPKIMKQK